MAKFKKHEEYASKPSGGYSTLKVDVNLNVGGEFYFKIPKEFETFTKKVVSEFVDESEDSEKLYIEKGNLIANSFKLLTRIMQKIVHLAANSDLKEELVIRYRIENNTVYYKYHDGTIAPDDEEDPHRNTDKRTGTWFGDRSSTNRRTHFSVNVAAIVATKTTQTGSDSIAYGNPWHLHTIDINEKDNEFLMKLNSFDRISFRDDEWNATDFKEMAYTEKRAKFFYEMLLGMCKLADRFSVLDDDENTLKLADSGQSLLVAPDKK